MSSQSHPLAAAGVLVALLSGCAATTDVEDSRTAETEEASAATQDATSDATQDADGDEQTFTVSVWADNWFALHVNGELVLEDSVPITTERSFNAETSTFTASYPLTLAVEAKDFKETDSGLEYIGEPNQQMGDGGLILQITDEAGELVAVTSSAWSTLLVHRAPLNPDCESSPDPNTDCEFEILPTPTDWTSPTFDDTTWTPATEWSESAVSPKDGYTQIQWSPTANLIWGPDLEQDNTLLLRLTLQP